MKVKASKNFLSVTISEHEQLFLGDGKQMFADSYCSIQKPIQIWHVKPCPPFRNAEVVLSGLEARGLTGFCHVQVGVFVLHSDIWRILLVHIATRITFSWWALSGTQQGVFSLAFSHALTWNGRLASRAKKSALHQRSIWVYFKESSPPDQRLRMHIITQNKLCLKMCLTHSWWFW